MEWYYALNNQQNGPISDTDFRQLVKMGVIQPDTLVWREGMANWVPYQQIASSIGAPTNVPAPTSYTQAPVSYAMDRFQRQQPAGTGGATPNSQLRATARESLSGVWGAAIGFIVVMWLVNFGINLASGIVPFVGVLIPIIVGGPLTLGMMTNFLNISRGQGSDFANIFSGFQDFARALGVYLLSALVILAAVFIIGLICALLVGIVAAVTGGLSEASFEEPNPLVGVFTLLAVMVVICVAIYIGMMFSQVYYIMVDNRDMGVIDVLKSSYGMMKGQKGKLIMLNLSFIGWAILCVFTLFIGYLFLVPYMMVASAKFYDDIR